jgi:hypothetical protein
MLNRGRRALACLCIIALSINLTQCYRWRPVDTAEVIAPDRTGPMTERVVGVTLRDGTELRFDKSVVTFIAGDSIHSTIASARWGVPIADVQRVWIAKIDPIRTTFAVIGVTVGVAAALLAIAIQGAPLPPGLDDARRKDVQPRSHVPSCIHGMARNTCSTPSPTAVR